MTEMLLALARTVRRGRNADPELVKAAAEREIQFQRDLDAAPELHLIAAEEHPTYGGNSNNQGGS